VPALMKSLAKNAVLCSTGEVCGVIRDSRCHIMLTAEGVLIYVACRRPSPITHLGKPSYLDSTYTVTFSRLGVQLLLRNRATLPNSLCEHDRARYIN
jgi:hypothetical protein